MANTKTQQNRKVNLANVKSKTNVRKTDIFDKYNATFTTVSSRWVSGVGIVLVLIALLGLTWAIPFPKLKFLGQYAGYFNWASFVIAFYVLYYYFKVSPLYSYIMVLILFALSYAVTELDVWHQHGGLAVWMISLIAFVAGFAMLISAKKTGSTLNAFRFILLGPACILKLAIKK